MKEKNNPTPLISVIVPVYNVGKYLHKCVDSILMQSYSNFEIILVDDGSTDESSEICEEYKGKDKRIKVIHKRNEGLGMARNTGLSIVNGEYVFFIDSDDYIAQDLFYDCINEIHKKQSDIVFYGFKRITENGKEIYEIIPRPQKYFYDNKEEISNNLLSDYLGRAPESKSSRNLRISAWNCCIKHEILKNNDIKFVSERKYISEDVFFYLDIFKYLNRVSILGKAYYCYCQHRGSLTFSYDEKRFEKIKKFYLSALEYSKKCGYSYKVQQRMTIFFLSNTIGCLKMEVANIKNSNLKMVRLKLKEICNDECLQKVIREYPRKNLPRSWKIILKFIEEKYILCLFVTLIIQYLKKGV